MLSFAFCVFFYLLSSVFIPLWSLYLLSMSLFSFFQWKVMFLVKIKVMVRGLLSGMIFGLGFQPLNPLFHISLRWFQHLHVLWMKTGMVFFFLGELRLEEIWKILTQWSIFLCCLYWIRWLWKMKKIGLVGVLNPFQILD